MKRLTLLLLTFTGCWGAGPTPEPPDDAEFVFFIQPQYSVDCNQTAFYVGDVAVGGDHLYAPLLNWDAPMDCGDNMGGGQIQIDVMVHRVPLPGIVDTQDEIRAGNSNGAVTTRVAVSATGRAAWVHSPDTGTTRLDVVRFGLDGVLESPREIVYGGGFYVPTGFAMDDTYAFLVATTNGSNLDPNDPMYPSNNMTGGPTPQPVSLGWQMTWDDSTPAGITSLPLAGLYVVNDTLKTGLVANKTHVFVALRDMNDTAEAVEIRGIRKGDLMELGILDAVFAEVGVPVGLAANDNVLAWSVSTDYKEAMTGVAPPRCGIYTLDLNAPVPEQNPPIFKSFDFSCMDTAIDDTHVYFTIVTINQNNDTFSNRNMTGVGLARVSLADHTFESIDVGITSPYSGPRRVYLDGESVYAVDPFTVARISKSAFVGRHEF